MSKNGDIRWKQRFENYQRALAQLTEAVELAATRPLSKLEQQGLIQGFEFTHELAWNTLKDFLGYRGVGQIIGSRDATCAAFKVDLLDDGPTWMEMIKSRNLISHTYNEEVVNKIVDQILNRYHQSFVALQATLFDWMSYDEK